MSDVLRVTTALSMSGRRLRRRQEGLQCFCLFTLPLEWIKLITEEITRKSYLSEVFCWLLLYFSLYNNRPTITNSKHWIFRGYKNLCHRLFYWRLNLSTPLVLALTDTDTIQILKKHCHTQHNCYSSCYSWVGGNMGSYGHFALNDPYYAPMTSSLTS